jgi:type I restriction enzyme S subunit
MSITAQKPTPQTVEATVDSNLPEGWIEATLDQILGTFESGSRPRGGVRGISEGVPSVGGEHLNEDGGFRFDAVKFVPRNFFERMNRGHVRKGDILVVKDGATTGKVALVRDDFPYATAVVNEHVFVCRLLDGLYPPFFFYFLFSKEGQDRILENFRGSAQGGINQSFASGTAVPLAPQAEQKRIVAKIEELLAQVNATRAGLAKVPLILKHFRQAVLAAACSGRLTEDWRDRYKSGEWEDFTLSDVIKDKPKNGYSARPVNHKTAWKILTLTATTSGRFDARHFKYFDEPIPKDSPFWLQPGDILVQRGNTIEYVGIPAIYDGLPGQFIYPDLMIRLRANSRVDTKFLYFALSWEQTRNYLRERATGTAGSMPKINQATLVEVPIKLPPLDEQHEIVRRVEALFKLADSIEKRVEAATKRTEKLTQAILAKAFRGELVPTEAELARRESRDYEPASVLLERIRAARQAKEVTASVNGRPRARKKTRK